MHIFFFIFFLSLPRIEIYIQIFYKHMCLRMRVCARGMHIYNLRQFGQQRHSQLQTMSEMPPIKHTTPRARPYPPWPQLTTAMPIDHDAFGPEASESERGKVSQKYHSIVSTINVRS